MSDVFLNFCQLCNEVYGEASTTEGEVQQLALEKMTLEFGERDAEIFCRVLVGTLEGVEDMPGCLEALLGGNYFWSGTRGATLSLKGDDVYLTDRLAINYFYDSSVLEEYVETFIYNVTSWRERMALYKPSANATEVE